MFGPMHVEAFCLKSLWSFCENRKVLAWAWMLGLGLKVSLERQGDLVRTGL